MSRPILRLNDGFDHTSPQLRGEVMELQGKLNKEGFSLEADGLFGRDTEAAVKRFQREHGLDDDGVVGSLTWATLLGTEPPDLAAVLPTTLARNDAGLLRQLEVATKHKSRIDEVAGRYALTAATIGGVGSRESHWGLILKPAGSGPAGTGDPLERRFPTQFRTGPLPPDGGGFGRGLMQIDFDAHEFARTGNWRDPGENILYGCKVLADSRDFIQRKAGLAGRDLLRAALAGYNCGPGNALRAIRDGRDIDFYTTGRDYSRDVLNRAGFFQLHGWT
ncbi:MAG TPA: peptidoglycan-binding protein [Candidatus Methylomirabilis sp.]|nr:peptidoglycan-binding protein [Candidatus Methylomirabilis sp.]